MLTIHGTSGAQITFLSTHSVLKSSADPAVARRLVKQAMFMKRLGPIVFPRIRLVSSSGYVMERLRTVDWAKQDEIEALQWTKRTLATSIWVRPSVQCADAKAHYEYLRMLCESHAPDIATTMLWWAHKSVFGRDVREKLSLHLTHGDPTLDNIMLDYNTYHMMLSDPIPAEPKMPDVRAVDLGKMLQSVFGYEVTKYGRKEFDRSAAIASVLDGESAADRYAAYYFTALHFLRLIRYQPAALQPIYRDRVYMLVRSYL